MKRTGPGYEAMRAALTALLLGALAAFGALVARPTPAAAGGSDGVQYRIGIKDVFAPRAVTDLVGTAGEGQALLQWSAPVEDDLPHPKPGPVAQYQVRVASFTPLALGGDTTAWFNAATPLAAPAPGAPGSPQAIVTDLQPGVTYWFGLRSVDPVGNTSLVDVKTAGIVGQVRVPVKGIAGVTDLTALTGAAAGEVNLVWTAPRRLGQFDPTVYDLRVSTLGQIVNPAQFDAARPLTAFSASPLPVVGSPGDRQSLTVTGLEPGTSYYFALRAADAGAPPFKGVWVRNVPAGLNPFNVASARFFPGRPDPITDLTALPGAVVGEINVTWSAPANPNGVPRTQYVLKMSSKSVADLGGDATAWFNTAPSTAFVVSPVKPAGSKELYVVTGLIQNLSTVFYFGARTLDAQGEVGFIDLGAASPASQAKSRPRPAAGVINMTALAVPGVSGRIDLAWTSPDNTGLVAPVRYDIHVSSTANMADNAAFDAAAPLSAFSSSPVPAVSSGAATAMPVTGLAPLSTYYFAIRLFDSHPNGSVITDWTRFVSTGANLNANNFAVAPFVASIPEPVTDLTALTAAGPGAVALAWTAPRNANFSPVTDYEVRFASYPVSALAGDATSWFAAAASSSVLLNAPVRPGAALALTVTGLAQGEPYFFAVRAVDAQGETSFVDTGADASDPRPQAFARVRGAAAVTDLTALTDGASGAVDLVWTVPSRTLSVLPERYAMRVSSTGQIGDDAAFLAALPLSAFSPTPLPAVGVAGSTRAMTVTGLAPFTTYYFALRVEDSSVPVREAGSWTANADRNQRNFAVPSFAFREPDAVSDLTALPGALKGEILLSWTAPRNQNFVPISSYTVRFATFSPAALAGDATAWFLAASSSIVYYPASAPGFREALTVTGLEPGAEYFFGLRAFDQIGEAGHFDLGLDPTHPAPQARGRARGVGAVTDLAAVPGAGAGAVDLSWTAPFRLFPANPEAYVVRASTSGQIGDDSAFAAAAPLSAFSPSPAPAPGAGGARQVFSVTGLTPFVTYYFAVRVEDSSAPVVNAGRWFRDLALGRNLPNFTVPSFFLNIPEPVTDLTALPGGQEGEVALGWTAPRNKNLIAIARYEVRYATFSVSSLSGNATAWLTLSPSASSVSPAHAPGAHEALTVGGLQPGTTLYFAVRSVDQLGETSFADTGADASDPRPQAFVKPLNVAPAVPAGLAGARGLKRAALSWNDLPAGLGGKGLDFAYYRLARSTDNVSFVSVATATALGFLDRPLRAETTYYFRLSARDAEGYESAPSSSVAVLPFTLPPQDVFGLRFSRSPAAMTVTWSTTTRFDNGEAFFNPAAPDVDELLGYRILHATAPGADFTVSAVYGLGASSHTEADDGHLFGIKVQSFNLFKSAAGGTTISPLGEITIALGGGTSLVVSREVALALLAGQNGQAEDVFIRAGLHLEQNGGGVLQTVSFDPLSSGGEPVKNFAFPKPVSVAVGYQTDANGRPVPASAQSMAAAAAGARFASAEGGVGLSALGPAAAADAAKNVGLFWNDGKDFKKLYGAVDAAAHTVTAQTPNIGAFQVRTVFRDSGATFDLSNITTKVITPNGDGKNDVMIMLFDNPNHAAVTGKVYDLRGALVADMAAGPMPDSLQWDGKMNGKAVTSGVYLYQVTGDGKTFNGTIVVAR